MKYTLDVTAMMVLGGLCIPSSSALQQHGLNSTKQVSIKSSNMPKIPNCSLPTPHQSLIIKFASSLSISITFLALSLPLTGSISSPFSLNFSGTSSESNNPT